MKTKVLQLWKHSLNKNVKPCEGGKIVSMKGYNRFKDFYLCIPQKGIHTRVGNCLRYGCFAYEYFIDGVFIGGGRMDKAERAKILYAAGLIEEAKQYIRGYMLWKETKLGGGKINKYKEAARISHDMITEGGKSGHDARQIIRRQLIAGISKQSKCL